MDNNPSPGNKAGGLTTILEKSLGAVAKAGASPLNDVVEYAQPLTEARPGVHGQPRLRSLLGDRPGGVGRDDDRLHHRPRLGLRLQAVAVDQAVVQLRNLPAHGGRHRHRLRRRSPTGDAPRSTEKGGEILDYLLEVASGRRTKSEALGYGGAEFVPWQIGAVM